MLVLTLIHILKKNSSSSSPLTQAEILRILEKEYGKLPDRKTLRSALNELTENFEGVHCTEAGRKSWYMDETLSEEEQNAVMHALLFYSNADRTQINQIAKKLSVSSKILQYYNNIVRPKAPQPDFDAAEALKTISQAIKERLMLTFSLYIRRGEGVTELERESDGYVREYLVRPISVLAHNGSFSLLGSLGDSAKMKFFPLERIYGIRISNVKCLVMPHFPEGSPIYPQNIAEERFPRGGARSEIKIKAKGDALFEIHKAFKNVGVQCIGDNLFEVTFICNLSSAKRYLISLGDGVEVVSPPSLRGEVAAAYFRMAERYRR